MPKAHAKAERPGDANTSSTSDTKPPAPKLTIKQVIEVTVKVAARKPSLAPDIIQRTADAAGMEVVIIDAIARDAVRELARLLQDKIGVLAASDHQEACDLLTSIDEDLWEAVNAHTPEDDDAETNDSSSDD